jgi:hypothetical protein
MVSKRIRGGTGSLERAQMEGCRMLPYTERTEERFEQEIA